MLCRAQRRNGFEDKAREASARAGASEVLDALQSRPGDGALCQRELLRSSLLDALERTFSDGIETRKEMEEEEREDALCLQEREEARQQEAAERLRECVPSGDTWRALHSREALALAI